MHSDEDLPDFVDSEEELKREEAERQKLMEQIRQKHTQVTLPNLDLEVVPPKVVKQPSAQRDDLYRAFEDQREDFYKRLADKTAKTDLFANLSDSDSDENQL